MVFMSYQVLLRKEYRNCVHGYESKYLSKEFVLSLLKLFASEQLICFERNDISPCAFLCLKYHALGLLYHIKKTDRLAVSKLIAKHTKQSLRSPYAACMLVSSS